MKATLFDCLFIYIYVSGKLTQQWELYKEVFIIKTRPGNQLVLSPKFTSPFHDCAKETKKRQTKTQEAVWAIQEYSPHTAGEVITPSLAKSSTSWLLKFLYGDVNIWKWTKYCLNSKGKADHTIVQSLCVFLSLSVKKNYLMSHLQLATTRQLGLYSQAGDVFSSGIYSPHCCPARKTSIHSPAAP